MNNSDEINLSLLWESIHTDDAKFEEFAQKRHDGAEKIAKNAKEKGGPAMLSYHHFIVKLPYYKKAIAGKFNVDDAKKELKKLTEQLNDAVDGKVKFEQTDFQKKVGIIEVLGELLIKLQS